MAALTIVLNGGGTTILLTCMLMKFNFSWVNRSDSRLAGWLKLRISSTHKTYYLATLSEKKAGLKAG